MAGSDLFLGIDVGSASVRAGLFDANGRRVAFAVNPIQQFHPKADFVEQSSCDIWKSICTAVQTALQKASATPDRVRSIGVDATCSLVAVDEHGVGISVSETGEPDRDIIMWMDHRAATEQQMINDTHDDALRYVGGEVSIEMELPKILWLKRHFPDRYARTWRYFDLADYLVWKATGADVASVCTLTCKWNYLAHKGQFPENMLKAVDLDDVLPKIPKTILDLGQKVGTLTPAAARELGLGTHVVVAAGMIDAHAGGLALVGGSPEGNLALISGTSNCHMIVSQKAIMVPGVWGPYWNAMLPEWWLGEGGQSAAGALVEWTIRQADSWPILEQEAKQTGKNVFEILNGWVTDLESREAHPTSQLHVLADHHGNRSPRANPQARGALYGLTLEQGKDYMARLYLATLQAVAYGTRHIMETMVDAEHSITRVSMCGGATKNPLWVREYANATGCDIHLALEEDVVTLGASLLGAVACGAFADLPSAAAAMHKPGRVVKADMAEKAFHDAKYHVYLSMYDDLQKATHTMRAFI